MTQRKDMPPNVSNYVNVWSISITLQWIFRCAARPGSVLPQRGCQSPPRVWAYGRGRRFDPWGAI